MNHPLVSIVIPSYKPQHFEQCLRSALGQTYRHTEILVSDNCPTEEIREICAKFNNVTYSRYPVKGAENVINSLFSGGGEYIKPLFDDDILHPFCVERMVNAMSLQSQIELVFSASCVIDSSNHRVSQRQPIKGSSLFFGKDVIKTLAIGSVNYIGEFSSIMYRRENIKNIGRGNIFNFSNHDFTKGLADIACYFNIVQYGLVYYIDEELSYFRRDQDLLSNSNPQANPNFGFCISDGFDLVIAAHASQFISTSDLINCKSVMEQQVEKLATSYPQVADAYQAYVDKQGNVCI
jgi:glycosyltransferase involved in cell wall biosynthesis